MCVAKNTCWQHVASNNNQTIALQCFAVLPDNNNRNTSTTTIAIAQKQKKELNATRRFRCCAVAAAVAANRIPTPSKDLFLIPLLNRVL